MSHLGYWRKYVHEVLVNRLEGLGLSRKSVARLTDHPDKETKTAGSVLLSASEKQCILMHQT